MRLAAAITGFALVAGGGYVGYQHYEVAKPGAFCDLHECIGAFSVQPGYVVQCRDQTWSHAGGRPGTCSGHDGVGRSLQPEDLIRSDGSTMPAP